MASRLLLALALVFIATLAQAAESVRVRLGVHSDHTRIVLDWPAPVGYRVARDGDSLRISFDRDATFDLGAAKGGRPPLLVKAAQADSTTLELQVAPDTALTHRRLDNRVVLDLARGAKSAPKRDAAPKEAKPKPESKPASKPEPKAEPKPAATPAEPIPLPEPKPTLPVATAAAEPTPPTPEPQPATAPMQVAAPLAPAPPPSPPPASVVERLSLVVEGIGDGARLVFPWTEPVGAAAFARGDTLWLAFDKAARLELGALSPIRTPLILRADQLAVEGGTVLRLVVKGERTPVLLRRQSAWVVGLNPGGEPPATPIPIVTQPGAQGGPRLFLQTGEAGRRLAFTDPDSGDALQIVTLPGAGQGIAARRDFLEFRLLPTAQGIALAAKAEGVQARAVTGGVEIAAPSGLMLAQAPDPQETKAGIANAVKPALYTYDIWRGPGDDYTKQKQALQHAVADAAPEDRDAARMALAGFYFAHGYAQDALALLKLTEKGELTQAQKRSFLALRGAARLLSGRIKEAQVDLRNNRLDGLPEAALWRGLLAQAQGDSDLARREFAFGAGAMPFFPAEARVRFNLGLLDAALATAEPAIAEQAMAAIDRDRPDPRTGAEAELRRGRVLEASGRPVDALSAYDRTVNMEWRPARVRAEFARVNLLRAQEQIDAPTYVDRLESMRYAWRGDAFEVEMQQRLARAYAAAGDYRGAFTTLRRLAARQGKDSPSRHALDEELKTLFAEIFLGEAAAKISPVTALALYQEHRDLMPTGARGDQLMQRLADRLVEVDLLDRAIALLRSHAETGSKREKARGLTRVAALQLLDRNAEETLTTLNQSDGLPVDLPLAEERRLLKVRALVELRRDAEALAALDGAADRGAKEIRAELLWRNELWADAAAAYLDLLTGRAKAEAPMSDAERRQLLQAAIAMARAGDRDGPAKLKKEWTAKLAQTPEAEAFRVLTDRPDPEGAGFRQLAAQLAGVGELEAMMARYRSKPQG
jgi:outer membrane biosynthesis protein TonB